MDGFHSGGSNRNHFTKNCKGIANVCYKFKLQYNINTKMTNCSSVNVKLLDSHLNILKSGIKN